MLEWLRLTRLQSSKSPKFKRDFVVSCSLRPQTHNASREWKMSLMLREDGGRGGRRSGKGRGRGRGVVVLWVFAGKTALT